MNTLVYPVDCTTEFAQSHPQCLYHHIEYRESKTLIVPVGRESPDFFKCCPGLSSAEFHFGNENKRLKGEL